MMRIWILKIIRTANGKENMYSNIQILGLLKGLDNSWCKKVIQHYQIFLFKFRIPCCGRTFQPWRVYSTAVWVGTQGQSCPKDASKEGIAQREVPSHSPGSFSSSVKDNSLILTILDLGWTSYMHYTKWSSAWSGSQLFQKGRTHLCKSTGSREYLLPLLHVLCWLLAEFQIEVLGSRSYILEKARTCPLKYCLTVLK